MNRKHFSVRFRREFIKRHGGRCAYCGKENLVVNAPNKDVRAAIDHKIPIQRGGSDSEDNLQLLCTVCNSAKRDMTMDEFTAYMSRRSETNDIIAYLEREVPGLGDALSVAMETVSHDKRYAMLKPIYEYITGGR